MQPLPSSLQQSEDYSYFEYSFNSEVVTHVAAAIRCASSSADSIVSEPYVRVCAWSKLNCPGMCYILLLLRSTHEFASSFE